MGWIKEFNDLSLWFKSIVITLLITMPLWFFILYLYFPSFLQYDWYEILGFCFVPCFIWYFLTLSSLLILAYFLDADFNEISKDRLFWMATAFDTIFFLLVIAVILMILKIQFKYFVAILFGYKIISLFFIKTCANKLKKEN